MYTVVDTQATTFLHQWHQHQVVMDRKKKEKKGQIRELRGPSTNAQLFRKGGGIQTVLECGSRQSGCTSEEIG